MEFIKRLEREMPFGRVLVFGAIIYAIMLGVIDIFLLLGKVGVPIEKIVENGSQATNLALALIAGLFAFAFIMLTIFVPQVISLYPILGYFFTFVKDNRKIKILPLTNREKYVDLLKNWGKVILIYLSLGVGEAIYLFILFGFEMKIELKEFFGVFSFGMNIFGISFLSTFVFAFSIIIAAMVQNIYKIDKWKVIVGYVLGYIVIYVTRSMYFTSGGIINKFMVAGLSTMKSYVYILGIIYLVVFIGEIMWTLKNINRLKIK